MDNKKKRPTFKKQRVVSKWVACISCGHEYVLEPYAGRPECPICESKLYEEVDHYPLLGIRDDFYDY